MPRSETLSAVAGVSDPVQQKECMRRLAALRVIFDFVDGDQSGGITGQELTDVLEKIGEIELGDAGLPPTLIEGTAHLTFDEFVGEMTRPRKRNFAGNLALLLILVVLPFLYHFVVILPFLFIALEVTGSLPPDTTNSSSFDAEVQLMEGGPYGRGGTLMETSIILLGYQLARSVANGVTGWYGVGGRRDPYRAFYLLQCALACGGWAFSALYDHEGSPWPLFAFLLVGFSESVVALQASAIVETRHDNPAIFDERAQSNRLRLQYISISLGATGALFVGGSVYTSSGFVVTCWMGFGATLANFLLGFLYKIVRAPRDLDTSAVLAEKQKSSNRKKNGVVSPEHGCARRMITEVSLSRDGSSSATANQPVGGGARAAENGGGGGGSEDAQRETEQIGRLSISGLLSGATDVVTDVASSATQLVASVFTENSNRHSGHLNRLRAEFAKKSGHTTFFGLSIPKPTLHVKSSELHDTINHIACKIAALTALADVVHGRGATDWELGAVEHLAVADAPMCELILDLVRDQIRISGGADDVVSAKQLAMLLDMTRGHVAPHDAPGVEARRAGELERILTLLETQGFCKGFCNESGERELSVQSLLSFLLPRAYCKLHPDAISSTKVVYPYLKLAVYTHAALALCVGALSTSILYYEEVFDYSAADSGIVLGLGKVCAVVMMIAIWTGQKVSDVLTARRERRERLSGASRRSSGGDPSDPSSTACDSGGAAYRVRGSYKEGDAANETCLQSLLGASPLLRRPLHAPFLACLVGILSIGYTSPLLGVAVACQITLGGLADVAISLLNELTAASAPPKEFVWLQAVGQTLRRVANCTTSFFGPLLFSIEPRLPFLIVGGFTCFWAAFVLYPSMLYHARQLTASRSRGGCALITVFRHFTPRHPWHVWEQEYVHTRRITMAGPPETPARRIGAMRAEAHAAWFDGDKKGSTVGS